jgi:ectoine hydroxylase-related dioxygenase (phytanoyl-CoA dioxygenase family)
MVGLGFRIENVVFSGEECQHFLERLQQDCSLQAGTRNLMSHSTVSAIALNARMIRIASSFLGSSATPFRATLFEKSAKTNWLVAWHQDTVLPLVRRNPSSEWGPWSEKAGILYAQAPFWALKRVVALRLHLDKTTQENGALRVIPSSHESGVLSHEAIGEMTKVDGAVICEVEAGGVMAMSPLLIHASSKMNVDQSRRVLHIEYADSLELSGIQLAIA